MRRYLLLFVHIFIFTGKKGKIIAKDVENEKIINFGLKFKGVCIIIPFVAEGKVHATAKSAISSVGRAPDS